VALSGDGADEAFGGYRRYQGELLAERYRRLPALLRRGAIEPLLGALPEGKGGRWLERARRVRRFAAHAGKPAAERQAGWARLADDAAIAALLARPATGARPADRIAALRRSGGAADPLNAMLDADLALGLPDDMLAKVDRMSMANSLEVRCPFLDSRVIAAARAMPGSWKIARGRGKAILRRAFADALPAEVFERPKKGFEIPLDQWLRGPLAGLAESAVADDAGGWLKPDLPRRWWDEHRGGRRDRAAELWSAIVLAQWLARRRAEAA
jgi:asparagine synthase (glutamine-hydrolysing)